MEGQERLGRGRPRRLPHPPGLSQPFGQVLHLLAQSPAIMVHGHLSSPRQVFSPMKWVFQHLLAPRGAVRCEGWALCQGHTHSHSRTHSLTHQHTLASTQQPCVTVRLIIACLFLQPTLPSHSQQLPRSPPPLPSPSRTFHSASLSSQDPRHFISLGLPLMGGETELPWKVGLPHGAPGPCARPRDGGLQDPVAPGQRRAPCLASLPSPPPVPHPQKAPAVLHCPTLGSG